MNRVLRIQVLSGMYIYCTIERAPSEQDVVLVSLPEGHKSHVSVEVQEAVASQKRVTIQSDKEDDVQVKSKATFPGRRPSYFELVSSSCHHCRSVVYKAIMPLYCQLNQQHNIIYK